jgi:arylsulfatase A-like enzyme
MKLLVLVLRGLHAGAAGPYGNRWIDTPTLDALAAGGVVFDWHFAAHPDRAGADRAWRTGCYSFPRPGGGEPAVGRPDLFALLAEKDIFTRLVRDTAIGPPAPGWGDVVDCEGLDAAIVAARRAVAELSGDRSGLVWVELSSLLPPWHAVPARFVDPYFAIPAPEEEEEEEEDEEEDIDESAEMVQEEEEEPPPLEPNFDPTIGEIEEDDDDILAIQTTYAAAVSWVDAALARLLGELPDDIAVVLTADHGQALGEHGVVGPVRPWLHEEIVHVPLILYGPGWRAGHRVAALTQSVDLAPTLAELFGVSLGEVHGHSLLPLLGLEERSLREYACMGLRVGEQAELAVRTPDRALRLPEGGEPTLYVKPDDRCEVNDVAQHRQEYVEALAQTLRSFVAATSAPGPLVPPPLPVEEIVAS